MIEYNYMVQQCFSRKEDNMKIFQKVQGSLATNLYVTSNNKTASVKKTDSAFTSKPVTSVNAMLTRMNVKTGSERLLKSFKTSSANEALRLAEKQFGKMEEVKTEDEAKTASRTFKTARRKLSMQEKLRLIDEDRLEDDDFDL